MQLSPKQTLFLIFLFHFWILHQILNVLKKKVIVIANVFLKLQTVEVFVRKLSKEHRFRTGFGIQHVKPSQMVAKSRWECFYHVFSTFLANLIWKMSPLVLGEILEVFLNILTADGKYRVQGCGNMQLPIQMQLSEKQKIFSEIFIPFLESTSNFKHFEKKMIIIANAFPKLQTVNILVRPLSKKRRFRTRFDNQHVKRP